MLTDVARLKNLDTARNLISEVYDDIESNMPDLDSKRFCKMYDELQIALQQLDKSCGRLVVRAASHPPVERPMSDEDRLISTEDELGRLKDSVKKLEAVLRGEMELRSSEQSRLLKNIESTRRQLRSSVHEVSGRLAEHQNTEVGDSPGEGAHTPFPF